MDLTWLRQAGAPEVIVIFGGWAVGPRVFAGLGGDQDLLFVSDYRSLSDDLPDLSGYQRRSLVAWSFGVASYAHWQKGRDDVFERKVAINGTLSPVDRRLGVPPAAMQKTMDTLSEDSFQVFLGRCFSTVQPFHPIDVDLRKAELTAVLSRGTASGPVFDRIWICENDRIFPPASMLRAWSEQKGAVRRITGEHAPFDGFADWAALLQ